MVHQYQAALDAFTNYHLEQEEHKPSSILGGPALPALGHAVSGATGAAISNVISYPLDLVIKRLQTQKIFANAEGADSDAPHYEDIVDAVQKIYAQEGGISAFYAGCAQDTAKTVLDSFLFFFAYNIVRKGRLKSWGSKRLPPLEEIGVGMVAGAFAKLVTTPISNIVTRKQTAAMYTKPGKRGPGTTAIFNQILREKGYKGLWSGYSAALVLTVNPALTMLLHNTLLRLLVAKANRDNPGSSLTFLIAATSKAIASSLTYPFQLAKSRAQVSARKPLEGAEHLSSKEPLSVNAKRAQDQAKKATILDTVLKIARTEGASGLYQGLTGEIFKGFFTHGLTMLMKESIHGSIIQLYYYVLKALQRYPSPSVVATKAQQGVSAVGSNVSDAASSLGSNVSNTASSIGSNVSNTASSIGSNVSNTASSLTSNVTDKVSTLSTNATNTATDLTTNISEKVSDLTSTVADKVSTTLTPSPSTTSSATAGDPYRLRITESQLEEVAVRSQRSVGDVKDKVKEMSGRVVDIMVELIKEGKAAKADFPATYIGYGDDDE